MGEETEDERKARHALNRPLIEAFRDMANNPPCENCYDNPPSGFTCNSCGASRA